MIEAGQARIGIDVGGTFTDFVLEIGESRYTSKVLTTPAAPERAIIYGLNALLEEASISACKIDLIIHGTTLATNALIERKGARTGFVTTEGFLDIVESGFESRYEQYDLQLELPTPLVPRRWRFGVPERINSKGQVCRQLDIDAVKALVPELKRHELEAVAIGFLHSYKDPTHETQTAEILAEALPHLAITLSSAVSPEMREYERFSTACANAYIQPKIAVYLAALEKGLAAMGVRCPLLLMLSSGGLTTVETASRFPVRLVESGPAGGALFASNIARECGYDKVLSFDMGGTTAKICLVDRFEPQFARMFEVARVYRFKKGSGLPLRIPVIEMVEIGAGGGSVARIDQMNRIMVGPESAGSEPGPACYGHGGTNPTVTDADCALGRIDPQYFAGGKMTLDAEAAHQALAAGVGGPLKLSSEFAAFGITEMVDENMSNAARVHAIESGKNVADRVLIAFGGAAPLHTARVAEKLGVETFVIPTGAGVGSAVGFLRAPVAYEIVRSDHQHLGLFAPDHTNDLLKEMADEARKVVRPAAGNAPIEEHRTVHMRYVGQGHEIVVPAPGGPLTAEHAAILRSTFEEEYRRLYSRTVPAMEIEILTWVVRITTQVDPRTTQPVGEIRAYSPQPNGTRKIFDPMDEVFIDVDVFERQYLKPGASFFGPALVVERETATVISRNFEVHVNELGYLECKRIKNMMA